MPANPNEMHELKMLRSPLLIPFLVQGRALPQFARATNYPRHFFLSLLRLWTDGRLDCFLF